MPRVQDLVELKFLAIIAKHLGFVTDGAEGIFSSLTAAGNNSQANAYQIIGNINQFTTVTSTNNSAKLPTALSSANGQIIIRNSDSADSINLFPATGDSLNNLAVNTPIQISPNSAVICFKMNDIQWVVTKNIIDLTSDISGILPIANGGGLSGVYTPTLTNISNLDSSSAYESQYMRVGNVVTVSGKVDLDITTSGVSTQMRISLPIASNFTAGQNCAGSINPSAISGSGAITADTTNDTAYVEFIAPASTSIAGWFFIFTYRII